MRIKSSIVLGVGFTFALALGACKEKDPYYCAGAPLNNCLDIDAATTAIDAPPSGCTNNVGCTTAADPVCETSTGTCVQCTSTDTTACTGTTPTCGSDDACHACKAHTDCASDACLPDGSCGTDANVAYVDPAGSDAGTCTKTAPCVTVTKALSTSRPYVKFHGTTDEAVTLSTGTVTFLADPGAELTRSSGTGAILTVSGTGTSVAIYDLAISNAPNNASGYGVVIPTASGTPTISFHRTTISNNPGGGISASGGTLTVTQSTISSNAGGGISLSSTSFDLENNFIVQNGGATTVFGGVLVNQLGTGSNTLLFNTIADNVGKSGFPTGVVCELIGSPVTFSDNIIYGNDNTQTTGTNCSYTYSDVGPDTVSGTGNINADPLFVNATNGNFHITASSPCKDAADPAATEAVDFDGDARPQGTHDDIGADEYKP